jgi:hypothetical protein
MGDFTKQEILDALSEYRECITLMAKMAASRLQDRNFPIDSDVVERHNRAQRRVDQIIANA